MNEEDRAEAVELMERIPPAVKRALRRSDALVGLLDGILSSCRKEKPGSGKVAVECDVLQDALDQAESVRDKLTVVSQQIIVIGEAVGQPGLWTRANGEDDGDGVA